MMRKRQAGYSLVMVLIVLAIGAMLVVPSLYLTSTSTKNNQIVNRQVKSMYAADAAQEYIMWKLKYNNLGSLFSYDGQTYYDSFDCCGIPVNITIVMRATESVGGICLSQDDVIKPDSSVDPDTVPVSSDYKYFTYIIRLEQIGANTTQGLDAVYDIISDGFDRVSTSYENGSSYIRVDGGEWESIPDPDWDWDQSNYVLRWPASGSFESPIRDFTVDQVKELKFTVYGKLPSTGVYCNWVALKPWNTLSGASAPVFVGNVSDNTCSEGMLHVDKNADPEVIQPGVETLVEYTINITNMDTNTRQISEVVDYLPPEFFYVSPTSGISTDDPQTSYEYICGADRQVLRWEEAEITNGSIGSGDTSTLTFFAQTTKDVSGTYYNEALAFTDTDQSFNRVMTNIGIPSERIDAGYSWNSGTVIVPAYDSQTETDLITINANLSLILGGITIHSWQLE
ncbi:hypothetical protein ACFLTT_00315 [Chloroflexota bacterium]